VQGGAAGVVVASGVTNTGLYENNIGTDPLFASPSAGTGAGYDGLAADWSLRVGSPCANAGSPDTTGLGLSATDLAGGPRIVNGRIDMGPYESPNAPPVLTIDPDSVSVAVGNTARCTVAAVDPEGQACTFTFGGFPSWITIVDDSVISIAPAIGDSDTTVRVIADDGQGGTDTAYLKVVVEQPDGIRTRIAQPAGLTFRAAGFGRVFMGGIEGARSVEIYSPTGRQVRAIDVTFPYVFWDGRRTDGGSVCRGLYVIVLRGAGSAVTLGTAVAR
jgi:hypothetical protein